MKIQVGLRVVRGPDWKWGDQDGGEGSLGTVVEAEGGKTLASRAVVLWDNGYRRSYQCGAEGKYELAVYDSGPSGVAHQGITCGACHQHIIGIRWKCTMCHGVDLCTQCYYNGEHSLDHLFSRIDCKEDQCSVNVPSRTSSKRITARGLFPNAKVVRGRDWVWQNQDGGKCGVIKVVKGHQSETQRSVVEVEWTDSHNSNIYRAGHRGKVDLKCITPAEGGCFYPEHLPKLGAATTDQQQALPDNTPTITPAPTSLVPTTTNSPSPLSPHSAATTSAPSASLPTLVPVTTTTPTKNRPTDSSNQASVHAQSSSAASPPDGPTASGGESSVTSEGVPSVGPSQFATGDCVRVQLEVEIVKMMQDGHGGWQDDMVETLSAAGTVQSVLDSGDIRVRYPSGRMWTMNPDVVVRVKSFAVGDVVRILDDIAEVHRLQEDHGGWVDDMALSLGQVGRVAMVFPTGDIRVGVNGGSWTFNSACLIPAPEENPPELPPDLDLASSGLLGEDLGGLSSSGLLGGGEGLEDLHMKLLSMLGSSALLVAAAAKGDASTVREYLTKNPHEVNAKAAERPALNCAIGGGHLPVVETILEFNPDLEIVDEDGDTPLHVCAYTDEDEAAKLLLDRGAKLNPINKKGATPLIIAAVKGHSSVLRILVNHPQIKLYDQDSNGNTALHCAVLGEKNESVSILLEAGADPTLLNFQLCTPIHEAGKVGFLAAIEHFARKYPDHINLKKDDGYTALHLSALNDHLDVVTALLDMDFCNMNEVTEAGHSALHLAVNQGHTRIVERLVGFGIDLDLQDNDGDTALHDALILSRGSAVILSEETPQLKKVFESFGVPEVKEPHSSAIVACFLIQEGANILLQNKLGATPIQLCSPEVATVVMTFKESLSMTALGKFHGSLRAPPLPATTSTITVAVNVKSHPTTSTNGPSLNSAKAEVASSVVEECFLCESPVEVKFEPCGHAVLCAICSERAKKCVKCKALVKGITKLNVICPMCNEEKATATMRPCGHQFCPDCAKRMKRCFDCREEITEKEGLSTAKESPGGGPSGGSYGPNCDICLTEPKDTALMCGHQLCWDCAQKVDHCPVCRKFVTHRIRLFK